MEFGATNISHATKQTGSKLANKPTDTQLFYIMCQRSLIMENKVTPNQIIELITSLPDSEKYIFIDNGKYWVTQEWLCGTFAGRAFVNEILEDAVQEMIDYLYEHIGHDSMVGNSVTKSEFPNLERVKRYCTPIESELD